MSAPEESFWDTGWGWAVAGCLIVGGLLAFAVVLAITFPGGDYDPCVEEIHHAKTTEEVLHHGWYSVGGRPVWCGPGPLPKGDA